ncbi:E3 ubiquitin-protein ligase MARCHF11-like [Dermacentor andersoni]|uniref:E3 ubiquitin-protein ligase MARCHF11-like n=1 Tax=Dermacentor andersoni TaxID=34620 RepID=UPI003B3A6B58
MASQHNESSNKETRAESSERDHHLCFRQVNVRTLRNRCHRDDQDSSPEEKICPVPSSLPSYSQYPKTDGARHIPCSDSEPSQSGVVTPSLPYVGSSLEGEEHAGQTNAAALSKDVRQPLLKSPEAMSDQEDDSARDLVSPDQPAGYLNGAADSGPMCRICYEGDQVDPLVSPCSCTGTMGFVHVSCLELWLNEQNLDICELCGEHFPMAAQPGSVRRFFHYVWQSEGRLRQALLSDLFYFAMMTSVALFSFINYRRALEALDWSGLVWKIIVIFVTGAFHGYCMTCLSNRLRSRYHSFMAWQLENPVRRKVEVTSVREVTVGGT